MVTLIYKLRVFHFIVPIIKYKYFYGKDFFLVFSQHIFTELAITSFSCFCSNEFSPSLCRDFCSVLLRIRERDLNRGFSSEHWFCNITICVNRYKYSWRKYLIKSPFSTFLSGLGTTTRGAGCQSSSLPSTTFFSSALVEAALFPREGIIPFFWC